METIQNVSKDLNGVKTNVKTTVTKVTTYPKAEPITQAQDYHKQFVTNTQYKPETQVKKTLETVVEKPVQEIVTETITTETKPLENNVQNTVHNLDSNNQKVVKEVVTTTTTTKVNKNLNPELENVREEVVVEKIVEERVVDEIPKTYIRKEFKRPEQNDPNLFSTERNFVKDSGIDAPKPLEEEKLKEKSKVIVLSEKKPAVNEITTRTFRPTRRIIVRGEEKGSTPSQPIQTTTTEVVQAPDWEAKNRELMRQNEELGNRLNYIGNYEKTVDRNIEHNNEKADKNLESMNERINNLVKENNDLRDKINRGINVSQDLSKMDVTIDQIEQEHLDSIKGKLVEKDLKIKKLNDQLKTYTKETTTMEDYLHLKSEADRIRGEKNSLEVRRSDLENRMNSQTQEINRLRRENENLKQNNYKNIEESQTLRNIKYSPDGLVTKRNVQTTRRPSTSYTTTTRRVTRQPSESKTSSRVIRKPSEYTSSRKVSTSPVVTQSGYKKVEIKKSSSRKNLNPSEYKRTDNGVYQKVVNYPIVVRHEETNNNGERRITANKYDAEDYSRIILNQEDQQKRKVRAEDFLQTTETIQNKPTEEVVKTTTVKTTTIQETQ